MAKASRRLMSARRIYEEPMTTWQHEMAVVFRDGHRTFEALLTASPFPSLHESQCRRSFARLRASPFRTLSSLVMSHPNHCGFVVVAPARSVWT